MFCAVCHFYSSSCTFHAEARGRPVEAPSRVVQVAPEVPSRVGVEVVELNGARALRVVVDLGRALPADRAEIGVSAELHRELACRVFFVSHQREARGTRSDGRRFSRPPVAEWTAVKDTAQKDRRVVSANLLYVETNVCFFITYRALEALS